MSDCRSFSLPVVSVLLLSLAFSPSPLGAGGPKYVAGSSFFNPGAVGQPVHWAGGRVNYYVDQGGLNSSIDHQQAKAMVDAAAGLWSDVATAGVVLTDQGLLGEDVSGSNAVAGNQSFAQPSDVAATATGLPLAVIFDADGAVEDAVFGAYTSDLSSCQNNGVMVWVDNVNPDATIAHAVMVLNGRCATTPNLVSMMQYQLERAFGRILGLDAAQVNPGAMTNGEPNGTLGWPIMQPMTGNCGASGGICLPEFATLRYDDIAALNRMYPITADNLAAFPGKVLTAPNTVSIDGTITFRAGMGMQGVNVVARPVDGSGNILYQYTATFVSGGYFNGKHGNAVMGWTDTNGTPLTKWGSDDAALQGYFDLKYMPLPPGMTSAAYRVSFEGIDPMYTYANAVGPYVDGSPDPSGTLNPVDVQEMSPGQAKTLTVNVADSATGAFQDAISTESTPRMLPPSGLWCGRLSQVGQTDWFNFPVRGNRTFTVITEALDEKGQPSNSKAMPALGIWDAFAPVGATAVGAAPGLNGNATGESWLQVSTQGDDVVRLGIADMRGDGRPDYSYNGWVLYADTVEPQRIPAAGGVIVIRGMGFHAVDTVLVGGRRAQVTGVSPNEITAIAPAAAAGVSGSVDVEVDDLPAYYAIAIVTGGISYDAGTGDALTLVTAPANTVPTGVPMPFTVTALGPQLTAAGGVSVNYAVASGNAKLGCGVAACAVVTAGDGSATINVTAVDGTASVVVASLSNGKNVQAHFSGGTPPVISAITTSLSLAAGATVSWTTQVLVLNKGVPMSGQAVTWQTSGGMGSAGGAAITTATGVAAKTLTVGPLAEGQQATSTACLNGTLQCVTFQAFGARAGYATLQAVAGTTQSLAVSGTAGQIVLRVRDMNGNPVAGGMVTLFQNLYAWAPPCAAHGRCAQAQIITAQTATAISAVDGSVMFTPATVPGVATNMVGVAATGNASTLNVGIEQHP